MVSSCSVLVFFLTGPTERNPDIINGWELALNPIYTVQTVPTSLVDSLVIDSSFKDNYCPPLQVGLLSRVQKKMGGSSGSLVVI